MSTDDHAAQELEHIRAMIAQLDHVLQDNRHRQMTPVTSPDYWRARIEALLVERLSLTLESQVRALLARLDTLGAQHGCARRGAQHAPGRNPHC